MSATVTGTLARLKTDAAATESRTSCYMRQCWEVSRKSPQKPAEIVTA